MSESTPPVPGQIEAPNPLEMFWEKNRKTILFVMFAAIAAIGIYYAVRYFQQQARNATWSELHTVTHLDARYADNKQLVDGMAALASQQPQQRAMFAQYYMGQAIRDLVGELPDDIRDAKAADLDAAIKAQAGTDAEPLLLWVAASHAMLNEDWDRATTKLDDLEQRFAKHSLCVESGYPVQFRLAEPKKRERTLAAKEDDEEKDEKPTLHDAKSGSAVDQMRAAIAAQKQFRAQRADLYEAPKIETGPVAVIGFKIGDQEERTVRVRLFADKAPKHVENFLAKLRPGDDGAPSFYQGIRVHQIQKATDTNERASQFQFGWPSTKGEDDQTKWSAPVVTDDESAKDLEFEDAGISLFPGMVSAGTADEGKSSSEVVWINFGDAPTSDGERVVFGQVIEGMDVIEEIANYTLSSDEDEQSGQGRPRDFIEISSTKVEE